jgi:hypothetical protein
MVSGINNDIKLFRFIVVNERELVHSLQHNVVCCQLVFKLMVKVLDYCRVRSSGFSIIIKRDFVRKLFNGQTQETM